MKLGGGGGGGSRLALLLVVFRVTARQAWQWKVRYPGWRGGREEDGCNKIHQDFNRTYTSYNLLPTLQTRSSAGHIRTKERLFKNTECSQISALEKLDLPIAGGYCLQQTSSPNLEAKEDNKTTESPSEKRRPSAEQPWCDAQRGMTSASFTGDSRLWSWWQQVVVMVTAGCGHGGQGDSKLWS